jgi:hypothetical protein
MFLLMMLTTQALQCTSQELIPITAMIFDVIDDAGNHDAPLLQAHHTQWLLPQVQASTSAPAFELIPSTRRTS